MKRLNSIDTFYETCTFYERFESVQAELIQRMYKRTSCELREDIGNQVSDRLWKSLQRYKITFTKPEL